MIDTRTRLLFFVCLTDAAGAALKNAAPAPGSDLQKNRLRSRPRSGGSRRLRNTAVLFVCLFVCMFVCLYVCMFVCLFVCLVLLCLFVCLFVCFVCFFVCLFVSL